MITAPSTQNAYDDRRAASSSRDKGHPYGTLAKLLVWYQLEVDQCRLDRRVSQPAPEEVDWDATDQQVASIAVSEDVVRDPAPLRFHVQLDGSCGRSLYPAVGRRARCPDQPVSLTDVAELECARERGDQLRMYRCTILSLLPLPSRMWRLVNSPAIERPRVSRAGASEILRPAHFSTAFRPRSSRLPGTLYDRRLHTIDWRFNREDARTKLRHICPA